MNIFKAIYPPRPLPSKPKFYCNLSITVLSNQDLSHLVFKTVNIVSYIFIPQNILKTSEGPGCAKGI